MEFFAEHDGNVIAAGETLPHNSNLREAIAATYARDNSPVSVTSVSVAYLRERCRAVTEEEARELHPRLFERLDR